MFSNGKFKNVVADVNESYQIKPGERHHKTYALLPIRGKREIKLYMLLSKVTNKKGNIFQTIIITVIQESVSTNYIHHKVPLTHRIHEV